VPSASRHRWRGTCRFSVSCRFCACEAGGRRAPRVTGRAGPRRPGALARGGARGVRAGAGRRGGAGLGAAVLQEDLAADEQLGEGMLLRARRPAGHATAGGWGGRGGRGRGDLEGVEESVDDAVQHLVLHGALFAPHRVHVAEHRADRAHKVDEHDSVEEQCGLHVPPEAALLDVGARHSDPQLDVPLHHPAVLELAGPGRRRVGLLLAEHRCEGEAQELQERELQLLHCPRELRALPPARADGLLRDRRDQQRHGLDVPAVGEVHAHLRLEAELPRAPAHGGRAVPTPHPHAVARHRARTRAHKVVRRQPALREPGRVKSVRRGARRAVGAGRGGAARTSAARTAPAWSPRNRC